MRFRIHGGVKKDERASFDLEGFDGSVLLTSGRFAGRDECMDGIRVALVHVLDAEHFEVLSRGDAFVLVLEGDDGRVLAESKSLGTENEALALRESILNSLSAQETYEVLLDHQERASAPTRWEAAIDFGTLYDFAFASRSGKPGFESFVREEKKQHYFHLNGLDGSAILYSRGFGTGARRDQRLRAVAEGVKSLQRFEMHDAEVCRFILKARNGQEIARSRAFASAEERDAAVRWVHENAAAFAEDHLRKHAGRVAGRDKYRLDLRGRSGKPGFEAFRDDEDKQHYFIFHDENGEPLLFSQGYQGKDGRDKGIRALIKNGIDADKLQLMEESGRPYFVIRAANHQAIARSRFFDRANDAQEAMHRMSLRLPDWAGAYGVELKTRAELQAARKTSITLSVERPKSTPSVPPTPEFVSAPPIIEPQVPEFVSAPPIIEPQVSEFVSAPPIIEPPLPEVFLVAPVIESEVPKIVVDPASAVVGPAPTAVVPAPAVVAAPKIEESLPAPAPAPLPQPGPKTNTAPVESKTHNKAWILPVVVLLAIFLVLWCRSGQRDDSSASIATIPSAPTSMPSSPLVVPASSNEIPPSACEHAAASASAPHAAESAAGAFPAEPSTSEEIAQTPIHRRSDFPPGSMEAELAAFLADPQAAVPRTFQMDSLRYPSNSHEVNDAGQAQVIALGKILAAYPNVRIRIVGHRDGIEEERYTGPNPHDDFPLSKLRAHCIYRRLRAQKVLDTRMEFIGENASNPITSDETAEGRQQNRRIDIVVLQK